MRNKKARSAHRVTNGLFRLHGEHFIYRVLLRRLSTHQNKTRHILHLVLPARERDFKHYKGKISRCKSKYEYFPSYWVS